MYLVDTSIIIDFTKGKEEAAAFLENLELITISAVTVAEVYRGARDKEELCWLEKELQRLEIYPVTEAIFEMAVGLVKEYTLSHGMHILDAMIAATAMESDITLATLNSKHFEMIEGLRVERPY